MTYEITTREEVLPIEDKVSIRLVRGELYTARRGRECVPCIIEEDT